MGVVAEFRRHKCPCGWQFPADVRVVVAEGSPVPTLGELLYACPECDRECATDLKGPSEQVSA